MIKFSISIEMEKKTFYQNFERHKSIIVPELTLKYLLRLSNDQITISFVHYLHLFVFVNVLQPMAMIFCPQLASVRCDKHVLLNGTIEFEIKNKN